MELEIVLAAIAGAMLTGGIANVLVQRPDLRLLDGHGENQVDGLVRIGEGATGIFGLIHVRKPHLRYPACSVAEFAAGSPLPPSGSLPRRHLGSAAAAARPAAGSAALCRGNGG